VDVIVSRLRPHMLLIVEYGAWNCDRGNERNFHRLYDITGVAAFSFSHTS